MGAARRQLLGEVDETLRRAIQARGASADAREGVTAFLEKRTPVYPNKVSHELPDIWSHWKAHDFS